MQTLCCNRPHYVESSNGQNVYCVNCGTAKPLLNTTYPVTPVWIVPYYYPPYNPYGTFRGPYCGDTVPGTLTGDGGSYNISSSTNYLS